MSAGQEPERIPAEEITDPYLSELLKVKVSSTTPVLAETVNDWKES